MDAQTISAIAAVASAVIAVGAAVVSTRSANRSAAAEEKSAKAAEEALAIEKKRFATEVDKHAEETAPKIDVGERHGLRWTLAQGGRALVGFVENHGPGSAVIESIALEGPSGPVDVVAASGSWDGLLEEQRAEQVQAGWPFGNGADQRLTVIVVYRSARSDYRAEGRFTLLRDAADTNGQPLWRSGEMRTRRL